MLCAKKCGFGWFCTLLGTLSGIAGSPTFCAGSCSCCLGSVARIEILKSRSRRSRNVPENGADFPAAIFLAGKCPNLGRTVLLAAGNLGRIFQLEVAETLP